MSGEVDHPAAGSPGPASLLFGPFELRLDSGELFEHGVPVKLQPQPAKVLEVLARHAGQVVGREEIRRRVWGEETFLESEDSINFSILQIRRALGDSASAPRFVETVPRRGYRFLSTVELVEHGGEPVAPAAPPAPAPAAEPEAPSPAVARRPPGLVRLAAMLVLALSAMGHRAPSLGPGGPIRLAVLPFESLGTVEDGRPVAGEALAQGLTAEVIAELVRLAPDRLSIIGSTSAMAYQGTEKTPREIGSELAVGHLLQGSVRRQGEEVRIAVQLVRAADGTLVWADHFAGELGSGLARLAAVGAAESLGVEVDRAQREPAGVPRAAYEAYLDAFNLARQRKPLRAREALVRAVTVAPSFAAAHAALAELQDDPTASEASARRAVALDPALASGHRALAHARLYRFDWQEAGREFELALRLDPGDAETHHIYAEYLASLGRFDEAIAAAERSWSLDPLSGPISSDLAWYYYIARRDDEAVRQARRTLELDPYNDWAQRVLLVIAMRRGDEEGGLAAARELVRINVGNGAPPPSAPLRRAADYWEWRQRSIETAPPGRTQPIFVVPVAVARGERERALKALEQAACQERSGWLLVHLAVEPILDPLRSDPRFEEAMDCVGIPADAREAGRRAARLAAARSRTAVGP